LRESTARHNQISFICLQDLLQTKL